MELLPPIADGIETHTDVRNYREALRRVHSQVPPEKTDASNTAGVPAIHFQNDITSTRMSAKATSLVSSGGSRWFGVCCFLASSSMEMVRSRYYSHSNGLMQKRLLSDLI